MLEQKNLTNKKPLTVIGPSVFVNLGDDHAKKIPAKIDTGATSSAIWASDIHIEKDGSLVFSLFGKDSPFYNGKIYRRKDYKVFTVRSAMGEEQIRYRTHFPITINGRRVRVLFSLADRSKNTFPILIGRSTIRGRFLVDVSLPNVKVRPKPKSKSVNFAEFKKDPHKFHQKYVADNKERSK
ncbi:ATP-dependent zinc protease [Candidatus Saccharibacteria bacterium]|nr:ATP-dependent zinc protease [Candidatus Saccharibacteria bacterium]